MKRLAVGAAVIVAALSACSQGSESAIPHIVAAAYVPPPPPPAAPAPAPAPPRAARIRTSSASRAGGAARPVVAVTGDVWTALARCESSLNPAAVGGRGRYFGAFQFTLGTWHSLGYTGNPVDYPYEVQLEAAQRLQARSGWGQWPRCSRRLGLR